ncbi:hypothetical protein I79_001725 [Cricetulus griseus]|uniref:Uncharacterized protein n=1 Tax=Cricetulus griseus TaxID=10029 RepID=G3GVI6_CRIGR|nr:hypothetical protein I79_001725 [Cricetulus griseus]
MTTTRNPCKVVAQATRRRHRQQSCPDLGWDPDANYHYCAGRPQSGHGSLQSLDSPEVGLSHYAGSA